MTASLIIRRIGAALALAIVITCGVALINEHAAALVFVPSSIGLFLGWPFLSRKLNFDFPKPAAAREARRLSFSRLIVTGLLATVLSIMFALIVDIGAPGIWIIPFWLALYYGWDYVTRRLPLLNVERAPINPAPVRPLWLRMIRGTVASAIAIVLLFSVVLVPLGVSFARARRVHDSIRIGMTVAEVLHVSRDCDIFSASSDFPYDEKAGSANIPAMSFGWRKDGTYRIYDLATGQNLQLSESEAIERLRAKLHDGYQWHFRYTYINMTPQHISFSVDFGPDGRVTEIKPVYGWD